MAAEHDGSIRIDTSLDNTGFEKGSEKLLRAAASVEQTVMRVGERVRNALTGSFSRVDAAQISEDLRKTESEANKAEAALFRLYERKDLMEDMGVSESSAQWQRLQLQIAAAERRLSDLESTAEALRADQVATEFREKAVGAVDGFISKVKEAGQAAGSFIKNLGKAAWEKFKNGVKSVASGIKNIGKHSTTSALSANKLVKTLSSFKNMLFNRIKSTFISYLTSELSTAMKELAKFDSVYDASISNMRNRTTELSSNLAASLGTLIKAIEPYITAAINAASNAMAKISAILAALHGEKTVTVAKKQTASYAESLSDSAGAAEDAAAAQKKLNAALSSYDQLHKLDDNSAGSSSGGGGGSSDLFETVPVDSILGDMSSFGRQIVERVKESIAKGDWYGAGAAVADGFNVIVAAINGKLVEIRPKAEQLATNVALGLNGLTENVDGYAIGNLLADGINLAFGTVNSFITTYNWGALGTKIGESINGLFLETDWDLIGTTFGNGINAVVDVLYNAVTEIKWRESGIKVGQGFNKLIKTVNWSKIGETFGESVKGVFGFIASTVEEIDWQELALDINAAIKGVDWVGVTETVSEALGAIVGGAVALLGTMIYDLLIEPLQGYFEAEFEKWDTGSLGLNIILGICSGIVDGLADIGTWIGEHIFYPFMEGFKKAFGIHSPSTKMAEQGDYIVQGLLNGIMDKWSQIPGWLLEKAGELVSGVKEKWDSLKTATSQKFSDLKSSMQQKWESIKSDAESKWSSIKSKVSGKAEEIKKDLSGKWTDVKTTAANKFSEVKTTLENKLNSTKTSLGNISFKSIGENIVSGLKNGITNTWNSVTSTLSSLASGLVSCVEEVLDINSPSRVFARIGGFVTQGLNKGIVKGEAEVMRSVSGMAEGMIDTMQVDAPGMSMGDIDSRMLSGLNQVAARFETIARAFAAIDKALASMGGIMIPQMATGTVIPAKVAIADSTRGVGRSGETDAEMIGLLKKIVAFLDGKNGNRPNDGTRVPIEIISKIDRREIARVMKEIDISTGRTTNGRGGGR